MDYCPFYKKIRSLIKTPKNKYTNSHSPILAGTQIKMVKSSISHYLIRLCALHGGLHGNICLWQQEVLQYVSGKCQY